VLHVPGQPSSLLRLIAPWVSDADRGWDPGTVFGGRLRREPELLSRLDLGVPRSMLAYLHRLSGLSGWWGLPWTIRRPALVITGDDDPIVPAGNSRILAACLPDAQLRVVRGGGHLLLFDSPAEVAPMIGQFLKGSQEPVRRLAS
jgi:pimeloyl-ACP methyl ester carboxylesterase